MKTSTLLRNAWALIEDPKHWTTRAYAKTRRGRVCDPSNPGAVKFCALGAIRRANFENGGGSVGNLNAAAALRDAAGGNTSAQVNDLDGHEAVRKMYAEAIRAARRREARQRGPGAARNRSPKERRKR